MPRDQNGNYSLPTGSIVNTGETVLPTQHNGPVQDLAAAMTNSLARDGQGGMRANLNMNGFNIVNLSTSTSDNSIVTVGMLKQSMPLGVPFPYAGTTPPNTWMFAAGQAISVAGNPDYVSQCWVGSALNATAGFGYRTTSQTDPANNRSNTGEFIVLPDLRGRVAVGRDDMGGADAERLTFWGAAAKLLGSVFGSASVVLTAGQLAKHTHTGTTDNSGEHNHTSFGNYNGDGFSPGGNLQALGGGFTGLGGMHSHPFTTNVSGNDEAHSNTQPSLVMNYIIKVAY